MLKRFTSRRKSSTSTTRSTATTSRGITDDLESVKEALKAANITDLNYVGGAPTLKYIMEMTGGSAVAEIKQLGLDLVDMYPKINKDGFTEGKDYDPIKDDIIKKLKLLRDSLIIDTTRVNHKKVQDISLVGTYGFTSLIADAANKAKDPMVIVADKDGKLIFKGIRLPKNIVLGKTKNGFKNDFDKIKYYVETVDSDGKFHNVFASLDRNNQNELDLIIGTFAPSEVRFIMSATDLGSNISLDNHDNFNAWFPFAQAFYKAELKLTQLLADKKILGNDGNDGNDKSGLYKLITVLYEDMDKAEKIFKADETNKVKKHAFAIKKRNYDAAMAKIDKYDYDHQAKIDAHKQYMLKNELSRALLKKKGGNLKITNVNDLVGDGTLDAKLFDYYLKMTIEHKARVSERAKFEEWAKQWDVLCKNVIDATKDSQAEKDATADLVNFRDVIYKKGDYFEFLVSGNADFTTDFDNSVVEESDGNQTKVRISLHASVSTAKTSFDNDKNTYYKDQCKKLFNHSRNFKPYFQQSEVSKIAALAKLPHNELDLDANLTNAQRIENLKYVVDNTVKVWHGYHVVKSKEEARDFTHYYDAMHQKHTAQMQSLRQQFQTYKNHTHPVPQHQTQTQTQTQVTQQKKKIFFGLC